MHTSGIAFCDSVALCLFYSLALSAGQDAAPVQDRPNIVWLVSEDNSKHYLKLFDPHGVGTPHIAELATNGIIFERAFSNSPVCSVARTTLMTGCYAPRLGAQFHRRSKMVPLPDGLEFFPTLLRQAGYYTTNRKKTDYNAQGGNRAWNESSARATWRNRQPNQPFFHMQTFTTTHESSLHFPITDVEQKPTVTDPATVFVDPRHPATALFQYTRARYHDLIQRMDRQIGSVVQQLRDDQLLDHTFIFYFSDHGGVLPGSKGYLFETGLHIPLVVRIPEAWSDRVEFQRGAREQGFVSFVDFGPTALKLAGVDVPIQMDGLPFLGPGISAQNVRLRNTTVGYADRFDEKIDLVRSLRHGDFKYIRNYEPFHIRGLQNNYRYKSAAYRQWRDLFQAGKLGRVSRQFFEPRPGEELYDLSIDPFETTNLASNTTYTRTLHSLRLQLSQHLKQSTDLSFFPESFLVEQALDNPAGFGALHQEQISALVDTADLAVQSWDSAQPALTRAVHAGDPWQRYWALVACSCFGKQAQELTSLAESLLHSDSHALVRARAAEFLAITGNSDSVTELKRILRQTECSVQANELLNILVSLRDGPSGIECDITARDIHPSALNGRNVERRLQYLMSEGNAK